jgi:hypothetical protein
MGRGAPTIHWNDGRICLRRQQTPLACDIHDEVISGYLHRLVPVPRLSPVMDHPAHPLVSIARSLETATTAAGQEYSHGPSTWNEIRGLDLDLELGVFDMLRMMRLMLVMIVMALLFQDCDGIWFVVCLSHHITS